MVLLSSHELHRKESCGRSLVLRVRDLRTSALATSYISNIFIKSTLTSNTRSSLTARLHRDSVPPYYCIGSGSPSSPLVLLQSISGTRPRGFSLSNHPHEDDHPPRRHLHQTHITLFRTARLRRTTYPPRSSHSRRSTAVQLDTNHSTSVLQDDSTGSGDGHSAERSSVKEVGLQRGQEEAVGGEAERKMSTPVEQQQAFMCSHQVVIAARAVPRTAADITHEAPIVKVEIIDLAPLPGLVPAANTSLNVWNAMQDVEMNRMAYVRVIERHADILHEIRETNDVDNGGA